MKFNDALKHSIKTLESPAFIEKIRTEDPNMVKYFPILTDINRHGFLTENSQAGKRTAGKSYQDGTPYIISERAFITGYMTPTHATEFILRMALETDKVATYVPTCPDTTHLPSALDTPLTVTVKGGATIVETHQSPAMPESPNAHLRTQVKLNKLDSAVMVFCYDTHWNRDAAGTHGLFTEVLKILKTLQ
jgi:hypothetical protein